MKIRLLAFVAALLLLPPAGFLLSGHEWAELAASESQDNLAATGLTLLALLGYTLLAGMLIKLRTGNNPLTTQRDYFLALAAAGAMLVWLLVYLNFYAASWSSMQKNSLWQVILDTLLFALPVPAALVTRALLGSFRGLLKALARGPALPMPHGETAALVFASLAAFGLLGGAALSASWLLWMSPLFLLLALQLLWHESTIFDVLREGDWGRLICAALSGLIVGNLGVTLYRAAGGMAEDNLLPAQAGYLLFGLLCLQLGDVIAENWRGKTRAQVFKKKPFPIPVVKK
ncbi:MAG: hypothetical protein M0P59_06075 [Gallionella sp.]|jgi:hypothetical protein|nr:hypothetical protein [Gallionella sp.]MCK9353711.1 hypothetical protein [Gallionella sp.]